MSICPKCFKENADGSQFCNYCGAKLNPVQKESYFSSIILSAWVLLTVFLHIVQFAYTHLFDNWYFEGRWFYVFISVLQNLILILPAIAIKKLPLKIAGCVIMALFILWLVIQNISFGFQDY